MWISFSYLFIIAERFANKWIGTRSVENINSLLISLIWFSEIFDNFCMPQRPKAIDQEIVCERCLRKQDCLRNQFNHQENIFLTQVDSLDIFNNQITLVNMAETTEPILQENNNRFVLFPIKHDDIWSLALCS